MMWFALVYFLSNTLCFFKKAVPHRAAGTLNRYSYLFVHDDMEWVSRLSEHLALIIYAFDVQLWCINRLIT